MIKTLTLFILAIALFLLSGAAITGMQHVDTAVEVWRAWVAALMLAGTVVCGVLVIIGIMMDGFSA